MRMKKKELTSNTFVSTTISSNGNKSTNQSPTKSKKHESSKITFLFGETIQLTCKMKGIKTYDSIALNYSSVNKDGNTFGYIEYKKIPKQL